MPALPSWALAVWNWVNNSAHSALTFRALPAIFILHVFIFTYRWLIFSDMNSPSPLPMLSGGVGKLLPPFPFSVDPWRTAPGRTVQQRLLLVFFRCPAQVKGHG